MTRTPVATSTERYASSLIAAGRAGLAGGRFGELCLLAKNSPRQAAELIIALAERADDESYADTHAEHLRIAHAAYARGERHEWVVEGERAYQREKKRRQKAGAT